MIIREDSLIVRLAKRVINTALVVRFSLIMSAFRSAYPISSETLIIFPASIAVFRADHVFRLQFALLALVLIYYLMEFALKCVWMDFTQFPVVVSHVNHNVKHVLILQLAQAVLTQP